MPRAVVGDSKSQTGRSVMPLQARPRSIAQRECIQRAAKAAGVTVSWYLTECALMVAAQEGHVPEGEPPPKWTPRPVAPGDEERIKREAEEIFSDVPDVAGALAGTHVLAQLAASIVEKNRMQVQYLGSAPVRELGHVNRLHMHGSRSWYTCARCNALRPNDGWKEECKP